MSPHAKIIACLVSIILNCSFSPAFGQTSLLELLKTDEVREHFDDRYNGFLEAYQPIQVTQNICANPIDQSGCLKVYILDSRSDDLRNLPELARLVRLNALAIPDDTILIDSFLLDLLFAHAFRNRTLKFVGAMQGYWPESIGAINWQQQFAMYDYEFGENPHVIDGWLNAKELAADLMGDFENFDQNEVWFTATVLGPLIEHEIYHLKLDAAYLTSFGRRIQLLLGTYDQIQEEREADLTGYQSSEADVVRRLLDATPDSTRVRWREEYAPLYETYSEDDVLSSLAIENITYLPDLFLTLALYDMFEGFRGLRTHEIFTKNFYHPCTNERAQGFTHYGSPDEIFLSEFSALPALTVTEFDALARNFAGSRPTGATQATHDHNLVRGISLNRLILDGDKVDYFDYRAFGPLENLMQALVSADPDDIDVSYYRDSEPIILTNPDAITSALSTISEGEPEACFGENCQVYRLADGGFFEVILDGEKLYRLQGYVNLRGVDQESYLVRMLALDHLLSAFGLDEEGRLHASASIRQSTFECRYGSGYFEGTDFDILSTSVSDQGVVFIRALAKEGQ